MIAIVSPITAATASGEHYPCKRDQDTARISSSNERDNKTEDGLERINSHSPPITSTRTVQTTSSELAISRAGPIGNNDRPIGNKDCIGVENYR
jgi:hypothetical protein